MCCGRSCECLLKFSAVSVVACALFIGGVKFWLSEKQYVFSADELASITTKALEKNKGGRFNNIMSFTHFLTPFVI